MATAIRPDEVTAVLRQELGGFSAETDTYEVGTVLQVGDGIARLYGLANVQAGELIEFPETGATAMVLNLEEDNVGAVLFDHVSEVKEGHEARRTGRIASINVSEEMLGRVVDPLGNPIDGRGPIGGTTFDMPLERKAPGVLFREPVTEPLQTGIKAIDAMIPVGRGQRELVIGDRGTGKTAVLLDTIINQAGTHKEGGKPVYCIYVAIGQKASTVSQVQNALEKAGAMEYTVIVNAPASSPAPLQFIAPFAGACIGEFFRDTGRHALVVYDDLSKQAVAYREVSLLLRRPPGREAYPGDVFYLHSRLLERAAKIAALGRDRGPDERPARQPEGPRQGRRFADGAPGDRDAGRRRVGVHPDERDLDHGRPDLPRVEPLQLRRAPGHQRRHLGVASRWQRADQGDEEGLGHAPPGPRAVPRAGGVLEVRLRPRPVRRSASSTEARASWKCSSSRSTSRCRWPSRWR